MSGIKERRDGKARPASAAQASSTRTTAAGTTGAATSGAATTTTATTTASTTAAPRETVRTRELKSMEQMGSGVLWAMFAVDEAAREDARVPKLVHAAKLFLIAVIFIAPVLLMWQHAF